MIKIEEYAVKSHISGLEMVLEKVGLLKEIPEDIRRNNHFNRLMGRLRKSGVLTLISATNMPDFKKDIKEGQNDNA